MLHLLGLPWWVIVIIVFILSIVKPVSAGRSFLRGFFTLFISWAILCLWASWQNEHVLSSRVAGMLWLPHWSLLVLCTGLLGGLAGGLSGLAGRWVRDIR